MSQFIMRLSIAAASTEAGLKGNELRKWKRAPLPTKSTVLLSSLLLLEHGTTQWQIQLQLSLVLDATFFFKSEIFESVMRLSSKEIS